MGALWPSESCVLFATYRLKCPTVTVGQGVHHSLRYALRGLQFRQRGVSKVFTRSISEALCAGDLLRLKSTKPASLTCHTDTGHEAPEPLVASCSRAASRSLPLAHGRLQLFHMRIDPASLPRPSDSQQEGTEVVAVVVWRVRLEMDAGRQDCALVPVESPELEEAQDNVCCLPWRALVLPVRQQSHVTRPWAALVHLTESSKGTQLALFGVSWFTRASRAVGGPYICESHLFLVCLHRLTFLQWDELRGGGRGDKLGQDREIPDFHDVPLEVHDINLANASKRVNVRARCVVLFHISE
jgi:hypothetical protein